MRRTDTKFRHFLHHVLFLLSGAMECQEAQVFRRLSTGSSFRHSPSCRWKKVSLVMAIFVVADIAGRLPSSIHAFRLLDGIAAETISAPWNSGVRVHTGGGEHLKHQGEKVSRNSKRAENSGRRPLASGRIDGVADREYLATTFTALEQSSAQTGNRVFGKAIEGVGASSYSKLLHPTGSSRDDMGSRHLSALQFTAKEAKGGEKHEESPGKHHQCLSIIDVKVCTDAKDCFFDDVYSLCFKKCSEVVDEHKCNSMLECRYEKIFPANACVNEGYQSDNLVVQDFHGIMRGCVWFKQKEGCDMMSKHYHLMKEKEKTLGFQCQWTDTPLKGAKHGGEKTCVNVKDGESMTPERMLVAANIAEKQTKLHEIVKKVGGNLKAICTRPTIKHAQFEPDKEFYMPAETTTITCADGFLRTGSVKTIKCTAEGKFEPFVGCVPQSALYESQKKSYEADRTATENANAKSETGGARQGRNVSTAIPLSLATTCGVLLSLAFL